MLIMFSQSPLMGRAAVRPLLAPVLARTTDAEALDTFFTRCGGGGRSLVDFVKTVRTCYKKSDHSIDVIPLQVS